MNDIRKPESYSYMSVSVAKLRQVYVFFYISVLNAVRNVSKSVWQFYHWMNDLYKRKAQWYHTRLNINTTTFRRPHFTQKTSFQCSKNHNNSVTHIPKVGIKHIMWIQHVNNPWGSRKISENCSCMFDVVHLRVRLSPTRCRIDRPFAFLLFGQRYHQIWTAMAAWDKNPLPTAN